jgi:hypothetical protein
MRDSAGTQEKAIPESAARPRVAPLSVTRAFSQHETFENEFSFAAWKRRFALLASDVVIGGFRPGFCFDNLIQRFEFGQKNSGGRLLAIRPPTPTSP